MRPFVFKIGGEAGFGIMSSGLTFSKVVTRSGYYVYNYAEYPSLIRGGHNVMDVVIGKDKVRAPYLHTNFLVALNEETFDLHQNSLAPQAGVLYESEGTWQPKNINKNVDLFGMPLNRLARESGGVVLMRNTVALGASVALLGGSEELLVELIKQEFSRKKQDIIDKNLAAVKIGYEEAKKMFGKKIKAILTIRKKREDQMVLTGNDAVALGAIAGGLQFASIYPMTPTSNILAILAAHQEEFNYIYKQPEDEISAINMALGASFAGARTLTATAGGGFCLMVEGFGLAGITETPIVIVEGMRPGPATGLPTWTEQGDLHFVLNAHQSDFPRLVVAPGDIEEAFYITQQAMNLAEVYQTPVVIMIDKMLCESFEGLPAFDYKKFKINRGKLVLTKQENFDRYKITSDGISPRSVPGVGNHYVNNSDEHNEHGYSNEEADNRIKQMEKRMRKLETFIKKENIDPELHGPKNAKLTIVSWGSNKGAILEAMKELNLDKKGKQVNNVNFLQIKWLNPFPAKQVEKVLKSAKNVLNIECNYSGQLLRLIREKTGINIKNNFLKYDGRPVFPEEIIDKVTKIFKSK